MKSFPSTYLFTIWIFRIPGIHVMTEVLGRILSSSNSKDFIKKFFAHSHRYTIYTRRVRQKAQYIISFSVSIAMKSFHVKSIKANDRMNRNPKQTYFHHNWNSRNVFIIFWIDTKIVNPQRPASFFRNLFELDVVDHHQPSVHTFSGSFAILKF